VDLVAAIAKVECSGKRLMVRSVGKFEDFETSFRIKLYFKDS
jgi:hypothetical protein